MTREEPISCMVIAPCSSEQLFDAAFRMAKKGRLLTRREFDRTTYWKAAVGASLTALYTRLPGTEANDWTIAEMISPQLGDAVVYTVWFSDERPLVVEWRRGQQVAELEVHPESFVRDLGFDIVSPPTPWQPSGYTSRDVVVVHGATVEDLRQALGDKEIAERTLRFDAVPNGAASHRNGGRLVDEPIKLASAFPDRVVYWATRDDEGFRVTVMHGETDDRVFRDPPTTAADSLPDILGARTPATIIAALGISPSLLGYP
jgi:hypothetical protein